MGLLGVPLMARPSMRPTVIIDAVERRARQKEDVATAAIALEAAAFILILLVFIARHV